MGIQSGPARIGRVERDLYIETETVGYLADEHYAASHEIGGAQPFALAYLHVGGGFDAMSLLVGDQCADKRRMYGIKSLHGICQLRKTVGGAGND